MEILSIIGLIIIGAVFLGAAYLSYTKDWRLGAYVSLFVSAAFFLIAVPATRAFLRTTAWATLVTGLEATGQGLAKLSSTIDTIRQSMTKDQAELARVQTSTREMQTSLKAAQAALATQQEKLADLDQLITSIYEARKTEVFNTQNDSTRLIALAHDGTHVTIYVILQSAPIDQTLDIQWHVFAQPKNSYFREGNLLIFRWGQSIDSFRKHQFTVTYVGKPKEPVTYSSLSIKGDRVMADNDPIIYGYAQFDPVIISLVKQGKLDHNNITMEALWAAFRAQYATDSPSPSK